MFPALKPQLQAAISSAATEEVKSSDKLMESAEKIERIAIALWKPMSKDIRFNGKPTYLLHAIRCRTL
jgi:hypothetical protein